MKVREKYQTVRRFYTARVDVGAPQWDELTDADQFRWSDIWREAGEDEVTEPVNGEPAPDMISHPPHYESHPSGVQPIVITRHETFCLGNVIKYCMRAKYKGDQIQDLRKAAQYLQWEIERLEGAA